ncbi:diaminopimelate epimerase [Kozakia baliensis]|uniref:Diaminopimelate epimerase n=1 Tax=Kozakia baliensis TaxID=153496 RepID=A0A1D8UQI6_9PROT|nr:diaminopimelate epimerase [Kozakia baliensis]AOX15898.1 diaminopimelate epimerase [Kozakia baliensis]AOX20989.1 diaminopimelate epimerase [Kozakia baliensis]GBR27617.1 diaminopimelate epimerase [Kozakia baliensis NRIC 0488]GEL64220.1 diaminopimelate epimerase [Kozakia baliensis]
MSVRFQKMQGLGNDFVVIDKRHQAFSPTLNNVSKICDRRLGIGCDQFVLLDTPSLPGADVLVRFFNPDGSEAGACGNASRCVAALLGHAPVLQTQVGLLPSLVTETGEIGIDMGAPRLGWREVPLARETDTLVLPLPGAPAACSMGNPHATFFNGIRDAAQFGPELEHDPLFPERANIGFGQIRARDNLRLRVWERGAGLTPACGSGACAAVVNGVRRNLLDRRCIVEMDGGSLRIEWREDGHVLMIGPATLVFEGEWPQ